MSLQNMVFLLNENAYQKPSDYDVVMLYEVLLGRNPENSKVIQDHRTNPFNQTLRVFLNSPEFRDSVLTPIEQGRKVRRHDNTPQASADQINWLFSRAMFDDAQKATLRQAPNWEQFFQFLCSLDGFLDEAPPAQKQPQPVPAARPAIPFKPNTRPLGSAFPPPVLVANAAAAPAAGAPSLAALMEKLERIEALVLELRAAIAPTAAVAAPPASLPPTLTDVKLPVQMDAAEVTVAVKPRSRRQAR